MWRGATPPFWAILGQKWPKNGKWQMHMQKFTKNFCRILQILVIFHHFFSLLHFYPQFFWSNWEGRRGSSEPKRAKKWPFLPSLLIGRFRPEKNTPKTHMNRASMKFAKYDTDTLTRLLRRVGRETANCCEIPPLKAWTRVVILQNMWEKPLRFML